MLDNDTKKAIKAARIMVTEAIEKNLNEAETRRRVERIFETVMGYDVLRHLTREFAVHGTGDTEYADFAIRTDEINVDIIVELKRVTEELSEKHIKQAVRYAIDIGCEWVLLTNANEWQVYHITFSQPPDLRQISRWCLFDDDIERVAAGFDIVSFKNVRKDGLKSLWDKHSALKTESLLAEILSESFIAMLRRKIRQEHSVPVNAEDVVAAIRSLLNDNASSIMDTMKICLPPKIKRVKKGNPSDPAGEQTEINPVAPSPAIEESPGESGSAAP